jgi:hypothetical protein
MVVRRPLVLSGQFLQEADDTDRQVILSSITYGSGLGNELEDYADNYTANVFLSPEASGLLLVNESSVYKLADDGVTQGEADNALLSGIAALEGVAPAYASGTEAQRISVEALASGNDALLANLSGLQLSDAAITQSATSLASGNAALASATTAFDNSVNAIISGDYSYGSGAAASADSVYALDSGNAALQLLSDNPFISEGELQGLIIALG